MAITLNSTITNNADWKTQFQFNDADTGDLLDFTGADIEIEIREHDHSNCWYSRIQASTDNGLITIISLGIFELDIPALQMQCLWPKAYAMGGVYTLNGETISLFTGTLTIIAGNSRL